MRISSTSPHVSQLLTLHSPRYPPCDLSQKPLKTTQKMCFLAKIIAQSLAHVENVT